MTKGEKSMKTIKLIYLLCTFIFGMDRHTHLVCYTQNVWFFFIYSKLQAGNPALQ